MSKIQRKDDKHISLFSTLSEPLVKFQREL